MSFDAKLNNRGNRMLEMALWREDECAARAPDFPED